LDNHSSGTYVTAYLKQPTRTLCGPHIASLKKHWVPIWSCSKRGLPCRSCYHQRGTLLPHHFNLTIHYTLPILNLCFVACALSPQSCMRIHFWGSKLGASPKFKLVRVYNKFGGLFSVALSVDSRLPGVTWRFALWSPDFPLYLTSKYSDCLINSRAKAYEIVVKQARAYSCLCFIFKLGRTVVNDVFR